MSRHFRTFSVLTSILLFVSPLGAQSVSAPVTAAPVSDARSLSLLNKTFGALNGVSAAAPASLVITGTYTRFPGLPNQSSADSIRIEALGPSSFRSDLNTSDGIVTNIIVGTSGWTQNSSGGRALAVGETFGRGIEMLPALLVSQWLNTSGVAANYVAIESLNAASVQHITITPPNVPPLNAVDPTGFERMAKCEVYIDSTTNLPARIR